MKTIYNLVKESVAGHEIKSYWVSPHQGGEMLRFVNRKGKAVLQYYARVEITFSHKIHWDMDWTDHVKNFIWIDIPIVEDNYNDGMENIPDYGDVYTVEGFLEDCNSGYLTDDDGSGYYATESSMSRIEASPSLFRQGIINKDFTHVVWFNK